MPEKPTLDDLPERIAAVHRRVRDAEHAFGRPAGSVALLAVSKRHPPEAIRAVAATGQRAFGENYVDEALAKQEALADLALEWHFIGPIQSNKTRAIAARFAWVQSVDRAKILRRLEAQRPPELPPLNALIQVHIGSETSKSGVEPAALPELVSLADDCRRVRVRGLMCIPPPESTLDAQRRWSRELRELFAAMEPERRGWDTLSMGMSGDLEAAVAEGSTMVRIGTDIFGPRS